MRRKERQVFAEGARCTSARERGSRSRSASRWGRAMASRSQTPNSIKPQVSYCASVGLSTNVDYFALSGAKMEEALPLFRDADHVTAALRPPRYLAAVVSYMYCMYVPSRCTLHYECTVHGSAPCRLRHPLMPIFLSQYPCGSRHHYLPAPLSSPLPKRPPQPRHPLAACLHHP